MMSVDNWIYKRAQISPKTTALILDGKQWTFREVYQEVCKFSAVLAQKIEPYGQVDRVGLISNNSEAMYFTILTCMHMGVEMVLLNTRLSASELAVQLADAEVRMVLCAEDQLGKMVDVQAVDGANTYQVLSMEACYQERLQHIGTAKHGIDVFPDERVMSILYTSGTTGKPKGVMQSYGNHYASAMASLTNLGFMPSDIWVGITPLYHISGLSIIVRSFVYGMPMHLFRRFDAQKVNQALLSGQGSIVSVVSYTLSAMLKDLGQASYPPSFRLMLLGGGFVDPALLEACESKGIAVVQSFGMTETCSQIIALPPQDSLRKMGSAGLPLFPNRLRIGAVCDEREGVGEIQIQSPALCVGYFGQEERYQATFTEDGWYRTGDLGCIDEEGYLYIKCRMADCIISGGENIYPVEIENCLLKSSAIAEVAVVGQKDSVWSMVPWAYLVPAGTERPNDEMLIQLCRQHLASYKIPKKFIWLDALPKTSIGKIQKYKLIMDEELKA